MINKLHIALAAFGLAAAGSALAADPIEGLARTCNNCHGINGVSAGPTIPSIGGLSEAYLKQIMLQWKKKERDDGTMSRLIRGYSDEDIAALAKYFSAKPWVPVAQTVSADALKKGKDVTERCETCHGATGSQPDDELTPKLHGQWARYLQLELEKYRSEEFKMTHQKMLKNARKLDAGDVATAAQFYAGQSK
jgi:cytochrome subunit of sulfide dehydrogenase